LKTKKVVLYLRISLSNSSQDTDRQLNDLTDYCNKNNFEIVEVFSDSISGKTNITQRKGLTDLFNFVSDTSNNIDGVCITELSRLGRDLQSSVKLIDDLTKMKIFVYSQSDNLITLDENKIEKTDSRMTLDILLVLSQNERKRLINRVKSGLKTKLMKENSSSGGMTLYGYKSVNKQMVVDEKESDIVKMVFDMYESGKGTTIISNYLNENNVPTRLNTIPTKINKKTGLQEEKIINLNNGMKLSFDTFRWSDSTIYFMLKNTTYKGYRIYKEETNNGIIEHKIKQPQIISIEQFDRVQEVLKSNYNKKDNNVMFNYIFENGLIKCGVCGRSYFPHNRVSGKDSSFKCLSKRYVHVKDCDNVGVGITKLYSGVWYFLKRLDKLEKILTENRNNSNITKDIEKHSINISKLNNDLKIIENNENTIVRKLLDGSMSETIYDTFYKEFQLKKEDIKIELNNIQSKLNSLLEFEEKQLSLVEQIRELKSDRFEMKKIVKLLVRQIVIFPVLDKTFSISNIKNDTNIFVKLYLYTSPKPTHFIISRYSFNILKFYETEYNVETGLFNFHLDIEQRIKKIKYKIESNVLL